MGTTKADIRGWLERAKREGATHMIVVCDTFDYDDYPVMVMPGEDARTKMGEYTSENMQRVMECYALHLDWDKQLGEHRAMHTEKDMGFGTRTPTSNDPNDDLHDDISRKLMRANDDTKRERRMGHTTWQFYKDKAGEWRWRALAENKNQLFNSSEGYVDRRDAEACARRAGWNPDEPGCITEEVDE
jgi:uncharacterized protein YegP (UPF0339 family)